MKGPGNKVWFKWALIILTTLFIAVGIVSFALSFRTALLSSTDSTFAGLIAALNKTDFTSLIDGFSGLSWSIIGVFLLCLTLYYQRIDYRYTEETNSKQRFETTFFNMIAMLIQIRNSITCKISSATGEPAQIEGYEYFNCSIQYLQSRYKGLLKRNEDLAAIEDKIRDNLMVTSIEREALRDEAVKVYEEFYKSNHACLGHYFRYIYHIVEFTLRERKECNDAELYLGILQAQLSDNELALLFYNGLSRYAKKKETLEPRFYNILDKYGVLENVDCNSLMSRNHHVLYPLTQFKFLHADERICRTKYFAKNKF